MRFGSAKKAAPLAEAGCGDGAASNKPIANAAGAIRVIIMAVSPSTMHGRACTNVWVRGTFTLPLAGQSQPARLPPTARRVKVDHDSAEPFVSPRISQLRASGGYRDRRSRIGGRAVNIISSLVEVCVRRPRRAPKGS